MTSATALTETYVKKAEFDAFAPWFKGQIREYQFQIPAHLKNATKLTRHGQLNYDNRKSWKAVQRAQKHVRSMRDVEVIGRASEDNLGVAAT